jgi:hypothetical protein
MKPNMPCIIIEYKTPNHPLTDRPCDLVPVPALFRNRGTPFRNALCEQSFVGAKLVLKPCFVKRAHDTEQIRTRRRSGGFRSLPLFEKGVHVRDDLSDFKK